MSGTPEGRVGILHLIAFLPSPPQEESKVMVQRRRSSLAAGSPQAEGKLLPFNSVGRLCVDGNGFRNLIQNKLT